VRIALCHEWTTAYGGSEQVAGRLARILDVRDVFTFAARPDLAEAVFPGRRVHVPSVGRTWLAERHWPLLLPLMPKAWSRLDLSSYDVVVTSAHACVNAVQVRPDAVHISYCHTPMRYAWDWRLELGRVPAPLRPIWPGIARALRRADRRWARRVTAFIANSYHVAGRIRSCYGREASVVHPPVDTGFFSPDPTVRREGFFVFAGRLVPYKRADIALEAARRAGVRLVVAGNGPELGRLRRIAGDEATFIVSPSREVLRDLYRRCRAFLNPGVEDFGMTMVEAQACGAPVIALGKGGALEIVVNGRTGWLYGQGSAEDLAEVLEGFEPTAFDVEEIRANAERFSTDRFDQGIRGVIDALLARRDHRIQQPCRVDVAKRLGSDVATVPDHPQPLPASARYTSSSPSRAPS